MKYSKFKHELKNEFKESFDDNEFKYEPSYKPKKFKKSIIVFSSIAAIVLIFFGVLGINSLVVDNHNAKVAAKTSEKAKLLNDNEYFKIVSTNPKDIQSKNDEYKYQKKIELPNLMIGCGGANYSTGHQTVPAIVSETDLAPGESQGLDSYETNNQKNGVSEADIAKFDTKYVYYLYKRTNDYKFIIYDLAGAKIIEKDMSEIIETRLPTENGYILYSRYEPIYFANNLNMQIYKDKIVIYNEYSIVILEFNGSEIKNVYSTDFTNLTATRLIDNYLYIIGNYKYNDKYLSKEIYSNELLTDTPSSIYKILKINLDNLEIKEVDFLGNFSEFVYMDKDYIVIPYSFSLRVANNSYYPYYQTYTLLNIYDLNLNPIGSFKVLGSIINQYSIDINNDFLRVVSTRCSSISNEINQLNIFNIKTKEKTGSITKNLGEGREDVRSVSFNNDLCYVVTYMQTDPLYEIDLSNPNKPTIISKLKVPGYSEYTYSFKALDKDYLLGVGSTDRNKKKISIYEVNNGNNIQIGEDFVIAYAYYAKVLSDTSDIYVDYFNDLFRYGYKLWIFNNDNILYLGVSLSEENYAIFKIDVENDKVISLYKDYKVDGETRLFLYNGKIYIPTSTKLIAENW